MIALLALTWLLPRLVPMLRRHVRQHRQERLGGAGDAAEYFDAVAGELRRGASLRHALAIPLPGSRAARLALTGQPIDLVAAELHRNLRLDDDLATAGMRLAARSGAPAALVFARLAARLRAVAQAERDRRALTAQARLSAGVIALLPVVPVLLMFAAGRGGLFLEPGPGRAVALAGLALQVIGLVAIGALLRAAK